MLLFMLVCFVSLFRFFCFSFSNTAQSIAWTKHCGPKRDLLSKWMHRINWWLNGQWKWNFVWFSFDLSFLLSFPFISSFQLDQFFICTCVPFSFSHPFILALLLSLFSLPLLLLVLKMLFIMALHFGQNNKNFGLLMDRSMNEYDDAD